MMDTFKIYLDTSILSAYFDFHKPVRQIITQKWFQYRASAYMLCISPLVLQEIQQNTDQILLMNMLKLVNSYSFSVLELNDEIVHLAEQYRHKILRQEINDTIHIAVASYYALDAIVSWNFRHIVNLKTMTAIQEVNTQYRYGTVRILSLENIGGEEYGTF